MYLSFPFSFSVPPSCLSSPNQTKHANHPTQPSKFQAACAQNKTSSAKTDLELCLSVRLEVALCAGVDNMTRQDWVGVGFGVGVENEAKEWEGMEWDG